ncbi:MAG: hypothetical protein ACFFEY_12480 [Candidatus Thorarchaeota archaeon]
MNEIIFYFFLGGIIFVFFFVVLSVLIKKVKNYLLKKGRIKRPTRFLCLDGDKVRSKGELIIDNHLNRLGVNHIYEKKLIVNGKPIKCDWYLPDYKAYIEYWGFYGKLYERRKQEKIELYKKGKLTLISIEDIMLEDIYPHLEYELTKNLEIELNKVKHCPNCGEKLDDRF